MLIKGLMLQLGQDKLLRSRGAGRGVIGQVLAWPQLSAAASSSHAFKQPLSESPRERLHTWAGMHAYRLFAQVG